ncbi:MAG: xanthine dehydrogenase accessory factor [Paracoccaceae bacterium]|jgi:xanthine dehydrogenase accessory factor
MAFDLAALAEKVAAHGRVARVVVTDTKGSTPRDAGTSMLVWAGGQSETIGGGTLEYQAVVSAREALNASGDWLRQARTVPLGPALGQCCGGSVNLLTEIFGDVEIAELESAIKPLNQFNRPVVSGITPGLGTIVETAEFGEEFETNGQRLWIYGAGHVGRALVGVLPALGFDVTWVDTATARYPETIPQGVTKLIAVNPSEVVKYAPVDAQHLVLTYSHALDLELCHQILLHSFQFAGLIGSATKWARFRKRLIALGHSQAQISRITCPIGQPDLGKEPAAIALGVAMELFRLNNSQKRTQVNGHAKEQAL